VPYVRQEERSLDVSSLPTGMYILSVSTDKGLIREKFLKE
jgi:hypothetical protein